MKQALQIRPITGTEVEGHATKPIRQALPFYKAAKGTYVHRVRSGQSHWRDGKLSHTHVDFWCGAAGFPGAKGKLTAQPGEDDVICATCEGRAIGAGLEGSPMINGRKVGYNPRHRAGELH